MKQENLYDIIVIGAGPAGLMAAGQAASKGASVLLLEKMKKPGKKLLITGKGRCNITTSDKNHNDIIENFGRSGRFLYSALSKFDNTDVIEFFHGLKLKTVEERGRRIFPESGRASDVLRTLEEFVKKSDANIEYEVEIKKFNFKDGFIESVQVGDKILEAKAFIICTGGLSYPSTGSTGEGYKWAKTWGHNIIKPKPSLVPLKIKEPWIRDLDGLSLRNVEISFYYNNKKKIDRFGEAAFIKDGIEGPIILDMSKEIGEFYNNKNENDLLKLQIDLKPALDFKSLDARVLRDFEELKNKPYKNGFDKLLPKKMIPVFIKISKIDPEKKINVITKEERKRVVKLLKGLELTVAGLYGFNRAIVTTGGIDLKEVDSKTMKSKIIKNVFFAGEILDLDGPTGGYNLQVCWSTGFVAGNSAYEFIK